MAKGSGGSGRGGGGGGGGGRASAAMFAQELLDKGRISAFDARKSKGVFQDYLKGIGVTAAATTDSASAMVTAYSSTGRNRGWEGAMSRAGLRFSYARGMYFVDFGLRPNLRAVAGRK